MTNRTCFQPDARRARTLHEGIALNLADSLVQLASACRGTIDLDETALEKVCVAIRETRRVPPVWLLRYHDARTAAECDDVTALGAALRTVIRADAHDPGGAVRNFGDTSLAADDWERYGRCVSGDGPLPMLIGGVPDDLMRKAVRCLGQARAAIATADSELAAEIEALIGDIVFAQPAAGSMRGFGGATAFEAWGAIVLNPCVYRSMVAMAGGLVHEAAHALLMGFSAGRPLVCNDAAERYPSPLRADLRPMDGIVHATFVSARIAFAMDRLVAGGGLDEAQCAEAISAGSAARAAFEAGYGVVAEHGHLTPIGAQAISGALAYMQGGSGAGVVLAAAEARYRAGGYPQAAALLEPWAVEATCRPDVLRVLGMCRLRLGQPHEALLLLKRALAGAAHDPWCQLHCGIALQAVGRHAEAIALFRACQAGLPADPAPWLNMSVSLLASGDVPGAIAAARRGRLRDNSAQAHYVLGVACLAAGQLSRAAACFGQAVRHAPRFVDGWVNLGVAQYRDGRIEDAKRAMRRALSIEPDHEAAAANLGSFLQLTGAMEEGEAVLTRIVARRPGAAAARVNLAASLLQEDRSAEALALLDGRPPGHEGADVSPMARQLGQHWRLQQALALIKLGKTTQAREVLDALGTLPPALMPLLSWRRTLLALAQDDIEDSGKQATAMAAELEQARDMLPEHRIMGHYDLAKYWSGRGSREQAFAQWTRGHELLRVFQPFSRAEYAKFVDAIILALDKDRLAQGARAANRDHAPVFVVGMPRSGTTLVEQVLSGHAAVHGAGERVALTACWRELSGASAEATAPARIAALGTDRLDAAAAAYLAELHVQSPEAARVIDKMPGNFCYLGLVGMMLPGARVIACERDPRDIGLSIYTYRFYGSHPYAHDLADLGWYIGQQQRLMAHWRAALPNPMLTVRLSDWSEDFKGTLSRVLEFLDLPYDAGCETFYALDRKVRTVSRAQVQQPINARGIGRWRIFETQLAPLIGELRQAGLLDETYRRAA